MKLTKSKLNKSLISEMKGLGFIPMNDTITGAQGLYIKKIENGLFLVVGLTISRYFDSLFTGAVYLSKVTRWASVWGDIPKSSYRRIAQFLSKEQRAELLSEEQNKEGIQDGWWDFELDNSTEMFIQALSIAEKKLVNDLDLINDIECSKDVSELEKLSRGVISIVRQGTKNLSYHYEHVPKKEVDKIPIKWFEASERVLKKSEMPINKNTVKHLAADAYRIDMLKDITNTPIES